MKPKKRVQVMIRVSIAYDVKETPSGEVDYTSYKDNLVEEVAGEHVIMQSDLFHTVRGYVRVCHFDVPTEKEARALSKRATDAGQGLRVLDL